MQSRHSGKTLEYMTRTFVREPDYMAAARARGEALRPGMQMAPYEGYMLQWLARMQGVRNAVEIGTFMGCTAMWLAEAGARVTSLESDTNYAEQAQQFVQQSPHKNRIAIVQGDALEWLQKQPAEPTYDLLFLDAEKRSYMKYLDAALPLLTPGALVVADNSLLWGAVSGEAPDAAKQDAVDVMRAFNARLAAEFEGVMLPTAEGLTVGRLK